MSKQENINRLIEDALSSVDDAQRAEPRPFLLTRIQARMNKGTESVWEEAGRFITRPAVAFTGLCMIVVINVMVVFFNKTTNTTVGSEQAVQTVADEYVYTVATIYDTDNTP